MAIASLVIGIISVTLFFGGWILSVLSGGISSCCDFLMVIPSIVGLILGIIALKNKDTDGQHRGMALAGIILNAIYLVIHVFMIIGVIIFGVGFSAIFGATLLEAGF